jgi:alpha-galactosidase
MDDCWASYRDANNMIQPDPKAFPSGIKALADYGIGNINSLLINMF